MTRALIWDLDGTLLDSYPAIMAGLEETYQQFQLPFDEESVRRFILQYSVKDLLVQVAAEHRLSAEDLEAVRATSLRERNTQIKLLPGAREVLDWTQEQGMANFIYTHKGNNAFVVLERLEIATYFTEVLTSQSGFARKPDPQALNYLIDKYALDRQQTYYVGDRLLDVQSAQRAGIFSLNLFIDQQENNAKIENLLEIPKWFSSSKTESKS